MRKLVSVFLCVCMVAALLGCGAAKGGESLTENDESSGLAFPYRIADRQEAVELYLSNTDYFEKLTLYDIQFRTQDKDGTVETLREFGAAQMLEFSGEEKALLQQAMDEIEELLREKGISLPKVGEITFVKSTQREEGGRDAYTPSAYTHGTQIYMNNYLLLLLSSSWEKNHLKGIGILLHEIFHCLTRYDPDFRREMYSLIGFHIADGEFALPESMAGKAISNPDVEHHNAYAGFTVNGEKKDCYLVTVSAQPFEKRGEYLNSYLETVLVSVDGKEIYSTDEAEDFWDVFGRNTAYVIDPEECLAENFSFALTYGAEKNETGAPYKTPELVRGILELVT